ncbi:hypothetical protein LCGC14_0504620 [marine sediment metagenome]|uniref:Cysteine dioxygenase n=1 Tax=marine sediment metagenome TaxID=412755 RepID=A0A0F9SLD6_9ZZZZ
MWLSNGLPVRIISRVDGERYLERYFLCKLWRWTFFLHRFRNSDPEEEVHDHPWNSIAIILSGWYWEWRWLGGEEKLYVRRWFNIVKGETFHRVTLPINDSECWTLFIHAPQFKPWGFLRKMTIEAGKDEMKFYRYIPMPKGGGEKPWYKNDSLRRGRDIRDAEV